MNLFSQAYGLAQSAHFPTALSVGGLVALLIWYPTLTYVSILSGVTTAFITLVAFLLNDINDVKSDSLSKPHRPLVRGLISKNASLCCVSVLVSMIILLLATLLIATIYGLLLILYFVLCICYTLIKARFAVCKDFYVGFTLAIPLLYGVIEGGSLNFQNMFLISAFIFYIAHRELLMDIHDMKGDSALGVRTIPVLFGTFSAYIYSWLLWILATCCILVLYQSLQGFRVMILLFISVSGFQLLFSCVIVVNWRIFMLTQWIPLLILGMLLSYCCN